MEGNTEAVKFLLKHGASTQLRDRFNNSPLDDAIKFRHKEIVKTLRKAGAQLMKTSMETAVELCRLAAKNRVDDLLVWQLAGVDLNACDYDKRTPLHVVSVGCEILISLVASVITRPLSASLMLPSRSLPPKGRQISELAKTQINVIGYYLRGKIQNVATVNQRRYTDLCRATSSV